MLLLIMVDLFHLRNQEALKWGTYLLELAMVICALNAGVGL
jgi:hypothetical protein